MIYMVVPFKPKNLDGLGQKIKDTSSTVYTNVAPAAWFLAFDGTSDELADKLQFGDDDDEFGTGIVMQATFYQGLLQNLFGNGCGPMLQNKETQDNAGSNNTELNSRGSPTQTRNGTAAWSTTSKVIGGNSRYIDEFEYRAWRQLLDGKNNRGATSHRYSKNE